MRRHILDLPLGVWFAALTLGALLLVGTYLQPLFRVPDERFHVDMIFAGMGGGWPAVQQRMLAPEIVASGRMLRVDVAVEEPLPARPGGRLHEPVCRPAAGYPACRYKPTFDELARTSDVSGPVNRMAQHPPAYYLLAGQMVATASSLAVRTMPFDAQIWLYRLVSVLLVAPVPVLAAVAARRTGAPAALQTAAAAMPAAIVGLTFRNGAIVNNDNLLMLVVGLILVLLVTTHEDGLTHRRAVWFGLLAGLSLLTKGLGLLVVFALPLSLWVIRRKAIGQSAEPSRHRWLRRLVTIAAVAFVAGGWWPVRNMIWYGTPQPAGGSRPPAGEGFQPELLAWHQEFVAKIFRTGLGSTGHFLTEHPAVLLGSALILVVLLALGTRMLGWRLTLALNLPLIVTYVAWSSNSYVQYTRTGVVAGDNARYYFPMFIGLVVVLVAGMRWISRRFRVPAPVWPSLVAAVAAGVTTRELQAILIGRWSNQTSYADGLAAVRAWAPAPIAIAEVAALLAALGFVAIMLQPWLRWPART